MLPGLEMMMSCPNLAVSAEVMRHVVDVESSANPFAIGVVGGHLARQPQNLDEAVATANMLEANGYNYSLGLAQVNRVNFSKYGLDTPAKAFDVCTNLTAGSHILADCYRDANGDWGKAFSCYYSGNFITGFLQGYVQKIYDSILRSVQTAATPRQPIMAIPVVPTVSSATARVIVPHKVYPETATSRPLTVRPGSLTAIERITMRSMPIDKTVSSSTVPNANAASAPMTESAATIAPATNRGGGDETMLSASGNLRNVAPPSSQPVEVHPNADIFVPKVRNLNNRPAVVADDPADHRKQTRDSAFVF
jgi:type IV secretion system protein VirB1